MGLASSGVCGLCSLQPAIALSVAYVTFVFRPPYEACPCGVLFDTNVGMSFLEIGDIVLKVNNEWLYRSRKKSLEAKALDGERGLLATVARNRRLTAART